MLFSTVEFLFIYFPATLALFLLARRFAGVSVSLGLLAAASVVFYGMWKPVHVPLLLGSVLVNYLVARFVGPGRPRARAFLAAGIALNLALLFWFKYASFASEQLRAVGVLRQALPPRALPLAISFFTFQQIAYLVDVSRGDAARVSLLKHLTFVSFFPHLIAGPITHPATILPQLDTLRPTWDRAALGLFVLGIGLCKKAALADPLGRYASMGFAHPETLAQVNAVATVAAYTMQLYLDFSGYSDMAVGLGLFFGIQLPWNFDSPYKARSIAEFWRHWHITLSDFLKNYVYIPLGGSHRGPARTALNLFITMLLGGIWHGAGWTFLLWGALHGAALCVNHRARSRGLSLPASIGRPMTMAVVAGGWVLFRAPSLHIAGVMYRRLLGLRTHWMDPWEYELNRVFPFLALAILIVKFAPNSRQLAERFRPSPFWTILGGLILLLGMVSVLAQTTPSEFLYFEF